MTWVRPDLERLDIIGAALSGAHITVINGVVAISTTLCLDRYHRRVALLLCVAAQVEFKSQRV